MTCANPDLTACHIMDLHMAGHRRDCEAAATWKASDVRRDRVDAANALWLRFAHSLTV
jgi:hypothetical protein